MKKNMAKASFRIIFMSMLMLMFVPLSHAIQVSDSVAGRQVQNIEMNKETLEKSADQIIESEIQIIEDAIGLLNEFADQVWPGWEGNFNYDITVTFPNQVVITLTNKEKLPKGFELLPGRGINGRKYYIKTSRKKDTPMYPPMSLSGHGDTSGINLSLMSSAPPESDDSSMSVLSPKEPATGEKGEKKACSFRMDGQKHEEVVDFARYSRMMTYIHELFHALQRQRDSEAQIAGTLKQRKLGDSRFDVTLEYSTYAEMEADILMKFFNEKDEKKAMEILKDFLVAREIKRTYMPEEGILWESSVSAGEGTAKFTEVKMAQLLKQSDYRTRHAGSLSPWMSHPEYDNRFICEQAVKNPDSGKSMSMDTHFRYYAIGMLQSYLLERFVPDWKKGFLENQKNLDEILYEAFPLSEQERKEIAARIKILYNYDQIYARHQAVLNEGQDIIDLMESGKGKKYYVDFRRVQGGFNVLPYKDKFISREGKMLFPYGVEFTQGNAKITAFDTPVMMDKGVYWVDQNANAGEQGYTLDYKEKIGDYYSDAVLITSGFTLTAPYMKISENEGVVKIILRSSLPKGK